MPDELRTSRRLRETRTDESTYFFQKHVDYSTLRKSMELPSLLLDRNVKAALHIVDAARTATAPVVDFDASAVVSIEPVAACALAVAARAASAHGRTVRVSGLSPQLRAMISRMECSIDLGDEAVATVEPETFTATLAVPTSSRANEAANRLADEIARFIPREDRDTMLLDHYGLRIHHAIQPALAHILSELVDNVFSHAVTEDLPRSVRMVGGAGLSQRGLDEGCSG